MTTMPGSFDLGPPSWNPTTEIYPGGPHPGAVHQMQLIREEEEHRAREDDLARRRRRFLLLK
jgi:hypothetical protein